MRQKGITRRAISIMGVVALDIELDDRAGRFTGNCARIDAADSAGHFRLVPRLPLGSPPEVHRGDTVRLLGMIVLVIVQVVSLSKTFLK